MRPVVTAGRMKGTRGQIGYWRSINPPQLLLCHWYGAPIALDSAGDVSRRIDKVRSSVKLLRCSEDLAKRQFDQPRRIDGLPF